MFIFANTLELISNLDLKVEDVYPMLQITRNFV